MENFLEENVKVPFREKHLDAMLCFPVSANGMNTAVILTHGAGGDMNFQQLVSLAHALASNGILCLRFTCKGLNLIYRTNAYYAVWEYLKSLKRFSIRHIYLGGRSMGSRAAAALAKQLCDQDAGAVRGIVCLSFPLHPAGQTHGHHQQRGQDLRGLPTEMPALFVSGTEDTMCDRAVFNSLLKDMKAQVTVCWLEGGSHGLSVKGRPEQSVLEEVNTCVVNWIINYKTQN